MVSQLDYAKLKVLVVEDEQHTRTIIKSLLRQMGIRLVTEAAHGGEGLVEVVRMRPHLILCDVHMEPVDGLAFLKQLREMKIDEVKGTPVIFLTADAQRDTVVFAKEHAVSGYIVKPPSMATLRPRVEAVLNAMAEKLPPAD